MFTNTLDMGTWDKIVILAKTITGAEVMGYLYMQSMYVHVVAPSDGEYTLYSITLSQDPFCRFCSKN